MPIYCRITRMKTCIRGEKARDLERGKEREKDSVRRKKYEIFEVLNRLICVIHNLSQVTRGWRDDG